MKLLTTVIFMLFVSIAGVCEPPPEVHPYSACLEPRISNDDINIYHSKKLSAIEKASKLKSALIQDYTDSRVGDKKLSPEEYKTISSLVNSVSKKEHCGKELGSKSSSVKAFANLCLANHYRDENQKKSTAYLETALENKLHSNRLKLGAMYALLNNYNSQGMSDDANKVASEILNCKSDSILPLRYLEHRISTK